MSCQNCVECLEYDENNLLAVKLDPQGHITANGSGELTWRTDIVPEIEGYTGDTEELPASCENGLKVDCSGNLWREPNPTVRAFTKGAYSFLGDSVPASTAYFTPVIFVDFPANASCYPMVSHIGVVRMFRFDQSGSVDYVIRDLVGGVQKNFIEERRTFEGDNFNQISKGYTHTFIQPANSGATSLGFQVHILTGPTPTAGVFYWIDMQFNVLQISQKEY
jgi:hypothetical protein